MNTTNYHTQRGAAGLWIGVVIILVIGGLLLFANQGSEPGTESTEQPPPQVPIDAEFDNKIVYTTDVGTSSLPFIEHCSAIGGTFNECGTICPTDAEVCADVCAFTCELDVEENTGTQETSDKGDEVDTGMPVPGSDTEEQEVAETEEVTVKYTSNGFSPGTITVEEGTTVTWENESGNAMWVASDIHPTHREYGDTSLKEHCPNEDNTAFDACGGTSTGESYSFTFTKVGEWDYHDHLAPGNTGVVTVE